MLQRHGLDDGTMETDEVTMVTTDARPFSERGGGGRAPYSLAIASASRPTPDVRKRPPTCRELAQTSPELAFDNSYLYILMRVTIET